MLLPGSVECEWVSSEETMPPSGRLLSANPTSEKDVEKLNYTHARGLCLHNAAVVMFPGNWLSIFIWPYLNFLHEQLFSSLKTKCHYRSGPYSFLTQVTAANRLNWWSAVTSLLWQNKLYRLHIPLRSPFTSLAPASVLRRRPVACMHRLLREKSSNVWIRAAVRNKPIRLTDEKAFTFFL